MDAGTRKQLLVTGGRSRFAGASSLKSLGRGLSKRKITELCIQNCAYRIVHAKLETGLGRGICQGWALKLKPIALQ